MLTGTFPLKKFRDGVQTFNLRYVSINYSRQETSINSENNCV